MDVRDDGALFETDQWLEELYGCDSCVVFETGIHCTSSSSPANVQAAESFAVLQGVQEPPDYVQCEGIRLLKQGGVEVINVPGYEDACLKAARRGLD